MDEIGQYNQSARLDCSENQQPGRASVYIIERSAREHLCVKHCARVLVVWCRPDGDVVTGNEDVISDMCSVFYNGLIVCITL